MLLRLLGLLLVIWLAVSILGAVVKGLFWLTVLGLLLLAATAALGYGRRDRKTLPRNW